MGSIVGPTTNMPVTREAFQDRKERFLAVTHRSLEASRDVVDAMPMPATMPAYSSLLADREDNLWVEEFEWQRDRPRVWAVFTTEGEPLGRLSVPAGLRVLEADPDYLVGVHKDEPDVEQVRVYRVERVQGR